MRKIGIGIVVGIAVDVAAGAALRGQRLGHPVLKRHKQRGRRLCGG